MTQHVVLFHMLNESGGAPLRGPLGATGVGPGLVGAFDPLSPRTAWGTGLIGAFDLASPRTACSVRLTPPPEVHLGPPLCADDHLGPC